MSYSKRSTPQKSHRRPQSAEIRPLAIPDFYVDGFLVLDNRNCNRNHDAYTPDHNALAASTSWFKEHVPIEYLSK